MDSQQTGRWAMRIGFIAFCLALFTGLLLLVFIDPSAGLAGKLPFCPLHAMTGLNCAGCGATRACHELLRGNVLQALAYNPLTVILSPFAAYLLLCWGVAVFSERRLPLPEFKLPLLFLTIGAIIAFSIIRNIPMAPFEVLAPHKITETTR